MVCTVKFAASAFANVSKSAAIESAPGITITEGPDPTV
jgi:hypothetical protein